jgi:hypothetical protein
MSQGSKIVAGVGCGAAILICCGTLALAAAIGNGDGTPTTAAQGTDTAAVTQAPRATAAPSRAKTWQTIQHFTGNQNTKTPTFHLTDGDRIVWSVKPNDQFGGNFIVTTYNSDGTYGDLLVNTTTPPAQSGTTNVHGDADVYLDISDDAGNYDIVVQAYR